MCTFSWADTPKQLLRSIYCTCVCGYWHVCHRCNGISIKVYKGCKFAPPWVYRPCFPICRFISILQHVPFNSSGTPLLEEGVQLVSAGYLPRRDLLASTAFKLATCCWYIWLIHNLYTRCMMLQSLLRQLKLLLLHTAMLSSISFSYEFLSQAYTHTDCPPINYNRTFSINNFRKILMLKVRLFVFVFVFFWQSVYTHNILTIYIRLCLGHTFPYS